MSDMDGKVALVTGGSSGIGRATAIALAHRGARVVLTARGRERGEAVAAEIGEAGGQAVFVPGDVSRPDDVERMVAGAVDSFGRLDLAVNNAASAETALRPTAEVPEDEVDRMLAVNLKGVWLCMREEIRRMLEQDPSGGAIVNVSSVNGLGGAARGSIYSATKAGVLSLSKSAAQEYASAGIRVNALAAGSFRTPMLESVFARVSGGDPEATLLIEERYRSQVPLGRIGEAAEAADAIVWLCSDASSYVTGHTLIVDGGLTSWAR